MEKKDYPLALFALIALIVAALACDLGKIGGEDQKASPLLQVSQPTPTITQPKVSQVKAHASWPTLTPTATPSPTHVPTSIPSATLTPTSKPPTPTATPTPAATPTSTATVPPPPPPPPLADIQFWVDNDNIPAGSCTTVHWHVVHVKAYRVDGQPRAGENGSFQTCPCWEERHTLHVIKADNSEQDFELTIHVYGECAAPPPPPEPSEPDEPEPPPTPTPEVPDLPEPPPTPTPEVPDLADKLYVSLGTSCDMGCTPCGDIAERPAIRGHDACEYVGAEGALCLYGLDPGDVVSLELYSPTGGDPFSSTVDSFDCEFWPPDESRCLFSIWLPIGIPTGQWHVRAVTDDNQIYEDWFTVDPHDVWEEACGLVDCDDANPAVNPGAAEVCDNGSDDDCDGWRDADDPDCAGGGPTCTDSDGGLSYAVAGYVEGAGVDGGPYTRYDVCQDGALEEFYCYGTTPRSRIYYCPISCADEACLGWCPHSTDSDGDGYADLRRGNPAIRTMPDTRFDPFEPHGCDNYSPGDPIIVHGANFEPGKRLPLGIYFTAGHLWEWDGENRVEGVFLLVLKDTQVVEIGGNGDFTTVLQALSEPGEYYVVPYTSDHGSEISPLCDQWVDCYWVEGRRVRHLVTYADGQLGPDLLWPRQESEDGLTWTFAIVDFPTLEDGRRFNADLVQEIMQSLPGYEGSDILPTDGFAEFIRVTLSSGDDSEQFFENLSAIEVAYHVSKGLL